MTTSEPVSQVDDRELRQKDLFVAELRKVRQKLIEVKARLDDDGHKADGEGQVKRREKKPARE
jgi:hypothetical protein